MGNYHIELLSRGNDVGIEDTDVVYSKILLITHSLADRESKLHVAITQDSHEPISFDYRKVPHTSFRHDGNSGLEGRGSLYRVGKRGHHFDHCGHRAHRKILLA